MAKNKRSSLKVKMNFTVNIHERKREKIRKVKDCVIIYVTVV